MKKILVLMLAMIYASVTFGQQKVAVYVTGDADASTKKVIGAKLVAAITNDDGYAAVERTADFLAELSKEQDFQHSGAVNNDQIKKLGEYFGADFVCVADLTNLYSSLFVSARFINVLTGLVTATAERDKEISGMADLTKLSDDVADGLINNTAECNKKDKPVDKKGCCAGLQAIDGVCRDMSGDMYWLATGACPRQYLAKVMPKVDFSVAANCPAGYRVADAEDLHCLYSTPSGKSLLRDDRWWVDPFRTEIFSLGAKKLFGRDWWSSRGSGYDSGYSRGFPSVPVVSRGFVCVRE
jgi:hypothetical protein